MEMINLRSKTKKIYSKPKTFNKYSLMKSKLREGSISTLMHF